MISHISKSILPPVLSPYLQRYATSFVRDNTLLKRWPQKCVCVRHKSYEGEGKTTVHILNRDVEAGLMIDSYSQFGFRLNNGFTVLGPMVIFPRTVLSWHVSGVEDINEDSLSLFFLLEPKIDILVLGLGDTGLHKSRNTDLLKVMATHKMNVEILPTEQACSTFNFLNVENRTVAAALIPPFNLTLTENDRVQYNLRRKKVFELNEGSIF